jgi:hypothetical protein
LAEAIWADRSADPAVLAAAYVKDEVADVKAALEGARDIVAETISENADLLGRLRQHMRARDAEGQGGRRQAGGRRQVLRLFRSFRALGDRAQPPGARHAARLERGHPHRRYRGRCRRRLPGEAGGADHCDCAQRRR